MNYASTSKESERITQLRKKIVDCVLPDSSDEFLYKWLFVQDFDVDKAEKMLRQALEWRRLSRADDIDKIYQRPTIVASNFSLNFTGSKDKYNCPVFFCDQGRNDMKGIVHSFPKKESLRYIVWISETIIRQIRLANSQKPEDGETVSTACFIIDMEGLSMKQLTCKPGMELLLEMFRTWESFYPVLFRRTFVLNASKLFTLIFNMIKPLLNPNSVNSIKIFGSNRDEWTQALLEEIDADQLPVYYGGTMLDDDGNPKCPSKFTVGVEIPREYYMSNSIPEPRPGMEMVTISGGSKKKIEFDVSVVCSTLRWQFMSEGGDIAFQVHFNDGQKSVELIPSSRIESHLFVEEGQITCHTIGKCIVVFDNSFSYLKSKKVHYTITVDSPAS